MAGNLLASLVLLTRFSFMNSPPDLKGWGPSRGGQCIQSSFIGDGGAITVVAQAPKVGPLLGNEHSLHLREQIMAVFLWAIIIARPSAPRPGLMCSLRFDLFSHLGYLISDQHYGGVFVGAKWDILVSFGIVHLSIEKRGVGPLR